MQFDKNKIYSTLQNRSEDDNGKYFIESQQEVYDFDEITQEVADMYRNKKPVASCDALYIKDTGQIYLIEFKNARKSRIGRNFFKQKAYDSVWTLMFAFFQDLSLEQLKERLCLIVVFNDEGIIEKEQESRNFQAIKGKMSQLAGSKERILFDLESYKGIFYRDIYTVEKNVFLEQMYHDIFDGKTATMKNVIEQ